MSELESKLKDYFGERIPYQMILFGPPGTGKSSALKKFCEDIAKETNVDDCIISTCFHPEYKYGDFVRRLLPISSNTNDNTNEQIQYKVFAGHLLKALKKALDNKDNKDKKVFLIIDELNRGNASAIFGNFFNLLDRDKNGESTYDIETDDLIKKIIDQEKIKFPENLHIFATINTNDENIFYMDSAFKRRWEWYFMDAEGNLFPEKSNLDINYNQWQKFRLIVNDVLKKIGERIIGLDDKLIGVYFIVFDDKININYISNKLAFHLWDSVFRQNKNLIHEFIEGLLGDNSSIQSNVLTLKKGESVLYKDFASDIRRILENIDICINKKVEDYLSVIGIDTNNKDELKENLYNILNKAEYEIYYKIINILDNLKDKNQELIEKLVSIIHTIISNKIEFIPARTTYTIENKYYYYNYIFIKLGYFYNIKKGSCKQYLPCSLSEDNMYYEVVDKDKVTIEKIIDVLKKFFGNNNIEIQKPDDTGHDTGIVIFKNFRIRTYPTKEYFWIYNNYDPNTEKIYNNEIKNIIDPFLDELSKEIGGINKDYICKDKVLQEMLGVEKLCSYYKNKSQD